MMACGRGAAQGAPAPCAARARRAALIVARRAAAAPPPQQLVPPPPTWAAAPAPRRLVTERRRPAPPPAAEPAAPAELAPAEPLSAAAQANLRRAAAACRRLGWAGFWAQLVLSTVAGVILLFSMAFTAPAGPPPSTYLTLFGVAAGYLSAFWSFGYTRLAARLRAFVSAPPGAPPPPRVRRADVVATLERGALIAALGAGAALLGLQATIGLLVAKTLSSATVNPFLASNTASWNPVLAFDVFNVQATTNALLGHFFSLLASLWLLRTVANRPAAAGGGGASPA